MVACKDVPEKVEEADVWVLSLEGSELVIGNALRADRGADELSCYHRGPRVLEISLQVIGPEGMDVAAQDDGAASGDEFQQSRPCGRIAVPAIAPVTAL